MTSPHREAGEAERERPGIVYPLLLRAARPDTRLTIDAALPEAAALNRRSRPPTVLEITESRLKEDSQPPGPRRRQSANAAAIAQRVSAGHPSARLHEATGVIRRHTLV